MNARDFENFLVPLSPRSSSDLDIRSRKLREARMLPSGGRGPHAPQLSAGDAATLLIAAAAARSAVDAVEGVRLFAPLAPLGGQRKSFAAAGTLGEAIEAALADQKLADVVVRIEMILPTQDAENRHYARFEWLAGEKLRTAIYVPEKFAEVARGVDVDPAAFGNAGLADAGRIGGGLLAQLALALADTEQAGYAQKAERR